jgi:hypothetical protein
MEEDERDNRDVKLVIVEFQLLNVHECKWSLMLALSQAEHPFGAWIKGSRAPDPLPTSMTFFAPDNGR